MLNLFNLKESGQNKEKSIEINKKIIPVISQAKKTSKHFPSPLREWNNSIYVYNKNSLNLIPSVTITVRNILKSYFNLFNQNVEKKLRTKRLLLRLRRLSSNKYYISNGEFKHTNNRVIINLYVFNRQKTNLLIALRKRYLNLFLKKTSHFTKNRKRNINVKLINKLVLINKKGMEAMKILNKNKYLLIKALNNVSNSKNYNINDFKALSNYTKNFYMTLLSKSLKKAKMYFIYKQLLFINKSKLNYTYLQYLKKQLEKLYNKNVEFNLINVKRFYLNSDILSESLSIKLRRNRRRMSRYLSNLKNKVNIKKKSFNSVLNIFSKQNLNNANTNLLLRNNIIKSLKYKYVTGFRLEAKGRLSRRYTASRSVYKFKYSGSLSDIDSSYKGLSTVILKGNLKSNTQYTKLKSKSRIGSFGIKGWVSGN